MIAHSTQALIQPFVEVSRQGFLYVTTVGFFGALQIMVYRSPIVRDTDEMYKPVLEVIKGAELIIQNTIPDPWMMKRKAEVSVYVKGAH